MSVLLYKNSKIRQYPILVLEVPFVLELRKLLQVDMIDAKEIWKSFCDVLSLTDDGALFREDMQSKDMQLLQVCHTVVQFGMQVYIMRRINITPDRLFYAFLHTCDSMGGYFL